MILLKKIYHLKDPIEIKNLSYNWTEFLINRPQKKLTSYSIFNQQKNWILAFGILEMITKRMSRETRIKNSFSRKKIKVKYCPHLPKLNLRIETKEWERKSQLNRGKKFVILLTIVITTVLVSNLWFLLIHSCDIKRFMNKRCNLIN